MVVEKFYPEKMICDLLESHHFFLICLEAIRKTIREKIKFIDKIIFLCFKLIIFAFLNYSFNDSIAIFESKMMYFCLSHNFHGQITLIPLKVVIVTNIRFLEKKVFLRFQNTK